MAVVPPAATRTVTLITGDQAVVSEDAKRSVCVIPRKGRDAIVFATTYQRVQGQPERLLVIPVDVQPLIDADPTWPASSCSPKHSRFARSEGSTASITSRSRQARHSHSPENQFT
jgi:hypothetical protein